MRLAFDGVEKNNNKKFFVDFDKRTVVCKLYYNSESFLDDLSRYGFNPASQDVYELSLIGDTYVGKAVCSENDTFNLTVGKRIAYKKAVKKLTIAKRKMALHLRHLAKEAWMEMDEVTTKLVHKYDKILEDCDNKISYIDKHWSSVFHEEDKE